MVFCAAASEIDNPLAIQLSKVSRPGHRDNVSHAVQGDWVLGKHCKTGVISTMEMERPLFGQVVRQVVRLRSEQLENCLEIQRRAGGLIGLGQVMKNEGLITRAQIMEVLRLQ